MSNPQLSLDEANPISAISAFFSGEVAANPFPFFKQVREMGGLVPAPFPVGGDNQFWMVTRMDEAVRILKDHEHFAVDPRTVGAVNLWHLIFPDTVDDTTPPLPTLLSLDEPDHKRLRGLITKAFTPRYIESLSPHVQGIVDELLDAVQGQGHMDIVADYAFPLTLHVISDLLGVPSQDQAQIREWSEALATAGGYMGGTAAGTAAMHAFTKYGEQLIAEKRKHPQNDLISQLIMIEEEGDRLSEPELLAMIPLLTFGGHETTSSLISTGILTLLDHPDQLAKLKADLSLVPLAVNELLRFNGSGLILAMPRFAAEDMEFAGQQIKKGDVLGIPLISANRDEKYFTDADELNIARTPNRHIAFGQGIHSCMGAPLARMEGAIAITTLLQRMPNLRLGAPRDTLTWRVTANFRGLTALPVEF